ncbi:MAG: hypothetical protein AAFY85_06260 [Pseudomonadota bacterium]
MLGLKPIDHRLHRRAGRGVRRVEEDLEIAGEIGGSRACDGRGRHKRRDGRFEHGTHGVLPGVPLWKEFHYLKLGFEY